MTKKDIPNIIEYITDPELRNLSLSEPQENQGKPRTETAATSR
jgi:hypothetical protein